jgi:DNA gyrase/topoisomerase IV subunit A
MDKRTIDDFFDTEYRAYAMYTIESRALPSVIDGFKPAQRKIAFAANKLWKSGNEKPMKVFQLGGQAAALSFFHHGSLDETIIKMTQDFKNSLPIFQGIGQFGSLRSPEAGAPRYVGVRFNNNFRRLYKDFDLVTAQYEEGEEIEPRYFLPIIPTVLLNGGSGIAVGFATNILNRHPLDLIDACIEVLTGKPISSPLKPWINGFHGEVEPVPDSQGRTWAFRGAYEVKNTSQVEITEIPPSFTYEKYETHLEGLVEKGTIHSYEDSSSDRVRYLLKFPRLTLADILDKEKLGDVLKMREQETENLTTLDENGKLKVFERVTDVVTYFVEFRLGYYAKRKARLLADLGREISILEGKANFVKAVIDGSIVVANAKKEALIAMITAQGLALVDGSYDYLLSMPIYSLTSERFQELLAKLNDKIAEREEVVGTTPTEFYLADLKELRKQLGGKGGVPIPTKPPPPAPKKSPVSEWLSEAPTKSSTKNPPPPDMDDILGMFAVDPE